MVKVVIIGGGFGGLNAAKALKRSDVELLVIDRTNHHVFQPLLYQVATAALSVENIASPIREILKNQSNATVIMAQIEKIDLKNKSIEAADGQRFDYDYLIVAPGARHAYFGHDLWEEYAPGLKTVADAVRIREKILLAFEKAERCGDPEEAKSYLRFAIIGAGPTGVEMAGSIAEFAHRTLFKNFRHINPGDSKIYLIEGGAQVLPSFAPSLAQKAYSDLQQLGVEVILNAFVTDVTPRGVYMGGMFLPASTVIWAAGNQASPLLTTLEVPLDRQGRVLVNPDLTIPGFSNVFVIGDAACCLNAQEEPLPGIAPVAIQQGRYVANLIKKGIPEGERKPFAYFDKGTIATIGRGEAVAMVGKWMFSGVLAWLVWSFVHILYLVSFRRRLLVMIQWIFLYLSGRRQGRVMIRPADKD
ncbi:Pyridine nucleotide-disulphide oxidoreductase family protein [Candidatus Protochlamydia naegleriophila]|uniref:NADH:ubiquinone reductase (non-electrogenic) n=1 Tax=Candidatus Protochlamydia naegleriophila TaxID=389348 RepID=A0A0U5JGP0_9BACT|nr:NAD(P)/FAD-dependent oxidoreductase [Candidatus Protochlamydia naegleriophila]CUI17762.1 Pyridine nucleotide-disulphide oxidoreductase family protein [Candidatus Protochlamydia naegleriophila]